MDNEERLPSLDDWLNENKKYIPDDIQDIFMEDYEISHVFDFFKTLL